MRNSGFDRMQRNRKPGKEGAGPSGQCICIKCGYKVPKTRGVPCLDKKCPDCGASLLREGGSHHQNATKNNTGR